MAGDDFDLPPSIKPKQLVPDPNRPPVDSAALALALAPTPNHLFYNADLIWSRVFARLSPKDLANAAQTCKFLSRVAKEVTASRCSDACQGRESISVPFINDIDEEKYSFFRYLKHCDNGAELDRIAVSAWGASKSWVESERGDHFSFSENQFGGYFFGEGCRCAPRNQSLSGEISTAKDNLDSNCGNSDECPCGLTTDGVRAYDANGRLRIFSDRNHGVDELDSENEVLKKEIPKAELDKEKAMGNEPTDEGDDLLPGVFECGPWCSCPMSCAYRVSQRGLTTAVQVIKHKYKGWGLHAAQFIAAGTFVCEYAGELLTIQETKKRQSLNVGNGPSYIMVVREHLPSGKSILRLNIDPTHFGNIARFINHSCDGGNLYPCIVRCHGWPIPRVTLFANRNIPFGEELSFCYGISDASGGIETKHRCFCGAQNCTGILPNEKT